MWKGRSARSPVSEALEEDRKFVKKFSDFEEQHHPDCFWEFMNGYSAECCDRH